jgi:hypothetical protein
MDEWSLRAEAVSIRTGSPAGSLAAGSLGGLLERELSNVTSRVGRCRDSPRAIRTRVARGAIGDATGSRGIMSPRAALRGPIDRRAGREA